MKAKVDPSKLQGELEQTRKDYTEACKQLDQAVRGKLDPPTPEQVNTTGCGKVCGPTDYLRWLVLTNRHRDAGLLAQIAYLREQLEEARKGSSRPVEASEEPKRTKPLGALGATYKRR